MTDVPVTFSEYSSEWEYQLDPPPTLFTALGIVVYEYSLLDLTISQVLLRLMEKENRKGEAVVAELSFRTKMHLIHTLADVPPKAQASFKRLMDNADDCDQRRNTVVHSSYHYGNDAEKVLRRKVTAKRKLKRTVEVVNIPDLVRLAAFMYDTSQAIQHFFYLDVVDLTPDK